ncbi:ankyrin repeat domain-containing protein [Taibaiella chishuiensis]|uniref:Ankyrin repeat protein n=1 Tax=Taibaiella chishuiensis TaxID=1434707 RepID=A0A2P8D7Q5_9BACT|nr:ankyrin repeat domain-containing protein [Taibaiella chishuiensis]PSK93260.1 ankyrin repeat protein [Taibaiella chishuiensis]
MAKKKKTLPKDFDTLIEKKDMPALIRVFDTCEPDARGGYGKATALSFHWVPGELVRWLVQNGADLEAVDTYNRTALHRHAMSRSGDVSVLLELGANVHAVDQYGSTPLHFAAGSGFNTAAAEQLIAHGADTQALDGQRQTPLECALTRASNIDLVNLVTLSKMLLKDGDPITQKMKDAITRRGEDFEFHRQNFNKDYLEDTDRALTTLYEMYQVTPVKKRVMHDGVSPITVSGDTWPKQFEELWELLVPSKGPAKTVQGEVVRIAGKVRDEIYRNGGGNWHLDFKKMLDAYLHHLSSGNALDTGTLAELALQVHDIRKSGDAPTDTLNYLCELANRWVLMNPDPVLLDQPDYKR